MSAAHLPMNTNPIRPSEIEPLARLARFTFDWAPELCDPAHGCEDYHRGWSTLRLFDLDGAIPAGWPFFHRELKALGEGAKRILVAGAADTGLPAVVASALPDPADATIVLTDRCETTLTQNRLFARHLRREFEFHRCDAREIACAPVDALVAHSFLIFFDETSRREVVEAWARVLKPGGALIMSNRLTPGPVPQAVARDTTKLPARLERLRASALEHGWSEADATGLEASAKTFWTRPTSHAISEPGLREMLSAAGFELLRLDYDDGDGPTGPLSGTHSGVKGRRAEIVARRRLD